MNVLEKLLEGCKYSYELIQHEKPILSAQDGAAYFGIEIGQTAPILIIKTDRGFFALVISGSHGRVDFTAIAKLLECNQVKLASKMDVKKITGCDIGSVPLIGVPLPYLIDKQLFNYPWVYGGTGKSTMTLKIHPQAVQELNETVYII